MHIIGCITNLSLADHGIHETLHSIVTPKHDVDMNMGGREGEVHETNTDGHAHMYQSYPQISRDSSNIYFTVTAKQMHVE